MSSPKQWNAPHVEGAKRYADKYGSLADEARRWRIACYAALVVTGVAVFWVGKMAHEVEVVPYIVQIDEHGYAVPIGPAQERAEVGTNVIVSAIRDFVVAWRSVWTDREAQQEMITRVYRMLVPASEPEAQISRWYNDNNPFDKDEGTRVTVEIGRIQVISARVLTIEWTESHRHPGSPSESRRFSAHIEVEFAARATMERVSGNPLGVYLHAISVTRQ
jgi:type IV secretion system protein VirB5